MHRIPALAVLMMALSGCYAATKSTVDLSGAQQKLEAARTAGAPDRATYAWTMADEFLKKARDEWSRSDYEAADAMIKKAAHWADQAMSIAQASGVDNAEDDFKDAELPEEESAEEPTTTTQEGVWQ
jgi:hypothetical protein